MKTMMKRSMMLLIMAFSVLTMQAQPHSGEGPRHGKPDSARFAKKMEKMEQKLGLNSEQKTKINALHLKHLATMELKMKEQEACNKTFRDEMDNDREKMHAEIKALLNDKQKAQFDTMMMRHNGKFGHGKAEGHSKMKGQGHKKCCCCDKE